MPYNGYPDQPEDQREQAWHEPDDAQADGWKGGEPEEAGDEWKPEGWPEHLAGPEYWLNKRRRKQDPEV